MQALKQQWHWWFGEPLHWIFYCFFQPLKFQKDINTKEWHQRYRSMWRLALPLFVYVYPPTLVTRFLLYFLCPQVYTYYYHHTSSPFVALVFDATWAVLLALTAVVMLGPPLFGLEWCIASALISCFWGGVAVHTSLGTPGYLPVAGCVVGMLGLVVGVTIASARDITQSSAWRTGIGSIVGITAGIPIGFGLGLLAAFFCGTAMYHTSLALQERSVLGSAASAILGGFFGLITAAIITAAIRGSWKTTALVHSGLERGLSLGMISCISVGAAIAGVMGTAFASRGEQGLALGINQYVLPNWLVMPLFILTYVVGSYRLPLYPWSAFSTLKAALATRKHPLRTFAYLYHSALYWDEAVYLPLPGLKFMLYRGIEKDIEETLGVASFVVKERVLQLNEVRPVVREIILRDLEERDTIERIAQAHTRLSEIIPQEASLIDPRWQLPFIRLEDASLEAARFCTPQGRQARRDALEQMMTNLKRVPIKRAFEDGALNARLEAIVQQWLEVARCERQKLEYAPAELGNIDNPYICGPALQANIHQFVGRRDLVQQLQQALSKGKYRPSFFLYGERRMGKTSTLNQLPLLLGARYVPIMFDLQSRGVTSNISTFLAEIAQAIHQAMHTRGMAVPKLEYVVLREAQYENEARVYREFDQWFTRVEMVLESEDRTLLLAFDEFEKLEASAKVRYFDLDLLLDWFRSVIQNRARLALLFSGVKTFNEMEANWPGYFINVKTLRVTFLHPVEAFRLITQPVHNYPSEQIFASGVVEEIMRVTGNHPFLIQALCSELIELLNAELRDQAIFDDVQQAVEAMFDHWEDTYFADLWRRTPGPQRMCLHVLQHSYQATLQQVVEQSHLEERLVQEALQALRRRDLVTLRDRCYQLAAPIYSQWIERTANYYPSK